LAKATPQFHLLEMKKTLIRSFLLPDKAPAPARSTPSARPSPAGSPSNRSLERGMEILRAFRPGTELLGNGDLAERTGLSRSTVSRLTQTLVGAGFLDHDPALRAYRLGPPVLSLAHAMQAGSTILQVAAALMRAVAAELRINVGLATPDRDEMVYLESVRYNRKASLRSVVAGQRIPIELTSLGRAWLAVAPDAQRNAFLARARVKRGKEWPALEKEINAAIQSVHRHGYCVASWQPQVVALAAPISIEGRAIHVLNFSVLTEMQAESVAKELHGSLLGLAGKIAMGAGEAS
jgi:DNA-binding IclR family transcriptional regulator